MKWISIGQICLGVALIMSFCLTGCNNSAPIPYEKFAEPAEPYKPKANSGNAWDEYLLAANLASKATEKWANQPDIKPGEEASYISRIQNALSVAGRASTMPCQSEFVPQDPFLPRPYLAGLSAIGKGLGIKIKHASKDGSANSAAQSLVVAHRMSNHLSHGDVQDALLGFWIASNARGQAGDTIQKMDAATLENLGKSILSSLSESPEPTITLENESKNALLGIQFIQDAYQNEDFELLDKAFYKQASPAIEYLQGLKEQERPTYFKNFRQELSTYLNFSKESALVPPNERKKIELEFSGERPWRRFSQHLFSPLITFIEARDRHVARSRLFALTCIAIAKGKSTGQAPVDLNEYAENSIDPYSGKPFPYQRAEREFKIYSVGADGRDDGGESKGRGLEPDLVIEPPMND